MRQINFTKMEEINGGEMDCSDKAGLMWGMGLVMLFNPATAIGGIAFMAYASSHNALICE